MADPRKSRKTLRGKGGRGLAETAVQVFLGQINKIRRNQLPKQKNRGRHMEGGGVPDVQAIA